MNHSKRFLLFLLIGLISLLAMSTILAQDNNGHGKGNSNNGNGKNAAAIQPTNGDNGNHRGGGNNGNGVGNGGANGQSDKNTNSSAVQQSSTAVPQSSDGVLGCQKNNPSRLDCSSLDVKGVCDGSTAQFIIHNSGSPGDGDMRAATQYRLIVDGVVVETGSVQLAGGANGLVTYSGGGAVTLEVDQQVGHPGNSHPRVTLDCGPAATTTAEPTEEITPTIFPTMTPTETATPAEAILTGEAICQQNGTVLFVITNIGSNMTSPADYTVTDTYNNTIDSGSLQIPAGMKNVFQYAGNIGLIFTVGDLVIIYDPSCAPATQEITASPTPNETPTVEPTLGLDLAGDSSCQLDGTILFTVYNYGSDMLAPEHYVITDSNGGVVDQGEAQVAAGDSFPLYYAGYETLTFTMGNLVINSPHCGTSTPEPTLEVTPPVDNSVLVGSATCLDDGAVLFTISNNGDSMPTPVYFSVTDPNRILVGDGWLQLMAGESTNLQYWGFRTLTFTMGSLTITQDAECIPPTPEVTPTAEPTQEVTPTAVPTDEVTPTAEPTLEVTPTVEPTEVFTPTPTPTQTGTLGCQKNNPDRKDCSSLQVTATCQNGVAVFTVRNTGKAGEGDMVSSTQYRILVDGVLVETGSVMLKGGSSTQISYSGGGTVTLEADQQTGHPGQSQPQATINCSG